MAITLTVDGFWVSPYAFSSWIALTEKKVPFTTREFRLDKKEHLDPAYRKSSQTGRVPALDHDGFWVAESNAIDEYLEDAFPAPAHVRLFPEDVKERARARQLQAWIRSSLEPIREERATHTMFFERAKAPLSEKARAASELLYEVVGDVLPAGKTQLFSTWSIADADMAFMLQRLIINGDKVPERVRAFADAQWKRPSIRAWVERPRPAYAPY
jgi:glutathione S-transferase